MADPRLELLEDLDNSKSRLIDSPRHIVVCGGEISVQSGREYVSARNRFLTVTAASYSSLSRDVLLPEEIKEWNHDAVYGDLLDFEMDLAHLTSAILLFPESPGSIAELGSFSCIPSLAEKLLLVIKAGHYLDKSFIALGPIRHIENLYSRDNILTFNYLTNQDFDPAIPDLVEAIQAHRKKQPRTEAFSSQSTKHALLLIADLVELFVVLRESEIVTWLSRYFNIPITSKQLRRYLFILDKLDLVKPIPYGTNTYLGAPMEAKYYVEHGTKSAWFKQERTRFKARVLQFYEDHDRTRLNAWKSAKTGTSRGA